jgi:NAD(P)-dependent dehydrogenase (short-subunit alcohol dehydrogenase family)
MTPTNYALTDQVAIVTGGGSGIGRAIALTLASAGADVVVADIVPALCEETVARIRETGRRGLAVPTDVMDTDQIRAMVEKAEQEFGRIDILVNNAGGVSGRPFLEQSERSWRKHIDLNLVSMLAATSAAAPVMIKGARGGAIINVASIEASRAAPNFAVYAACKAGMLNFTRTLAVELSDHKIRVNAIAPDFTMTPGILGLDPTRQADPNADSPITPKRADAIRRRIPLGRGGVDMECGNLALFLCSRMSDYITGAVIPIDGGTWASGGWVRNQADKWSLMSDL